MNEFRAKSLRNPDETIEMPGVRSDVVDIGDLTVAKTVHEPGWRWSTHIRPLVGGEWCQVRHVGVIVSGRLGILLTNGSSVDIGPDEVFDIPPGHDGYVIGHEPVVFYEWTGVRAFLEPSASTSRALVTLLVTDLVGSSARAAEIGDARWRELLSGHFEAIRAHLVRFRGREIKTTGDGMIATFSGPGPALRCAAEIRRSCRAEGLHIRMGVHVGEVEVIDNDLRGVAVHEAERTMAAAEADEILVSATTRAVASASGLQFSDRGVRTLKDLPGERRLYAYLAEGTPGP